MGMGNGLATIWVVVTALVVSATSSGDAWAWSGHGRLTAAMLATTPAVAGKLATYQPIATIIPKLGLKVGTRDVATEVDLIEYLRIKRDSAEHRGYRFRALAGEKTGLPFPVLAILAKYADEPDGWHADGPGNEPDTLLFDEDQYGDELWRPEYAAMGARASTASQAFRHMFWGKLDLWNLITSFKFPLSHLLQEMGVADERAQTYVDLSRRAKAAGSLYWQARFLANALHYLQDCSQPFHVAQTPSKELIAIAGDKAYPNAPARPVPGTLPSLLYCGTFGANSDKCQAYMTAITARTTNVVSYYHFGYERFIDSVMSGEAQLPEAAGAFSAALAAGDAATGGDDSLAYADRDPARLVRAMSALSMDRAALAARSAIDFFPGLSGQDLSALDAGAAVETADWWTAVKASAQSPENSARDVYFVTVAESFAAMGQAVRAMVVGELSP